jgi:UDP-glucose 4-epimerase
MSNETIILVTGVDGYWGAHVANRLNSEPGVRVLGLAKKPPFLDLEGLDLVDVGLDNPLLADFLRSEEVETICHTEFDENHELNGAISASNTSGTKRILEAGRQAGVKQIIIPSSTTVYGALPDNPAFLSEDMPLRGSQNYGYTRYWLEVESLVSEARQIESQTSIVVLRFANIIGSRANTPFTRFLNQRSPRILLGFDPVMQVVHEKDVIEAIAFSALQNVNGDFNIAAYGVMPLSRMMRILRKVPRPVFYRLAYARTSLMRKARCPRQEETFIEWDYLRYSFIADTAKMQAEMDFSPSIDQVNALLECAGRESFDNGDAEQETVPDDVAHIQELMRKREQERSEGIR